MDDIIINIVIISPGEEIYMWWGHVALIVEDSRRNTTRIFNWGTFTYPSDSFVKDFIHGQIRYFCSSGYLDMDEYANGDWEITAYALNLDASAKKTILAYAENNVLPENCYYDYQEFRDNCATRIRDIIDMGTRGQFKAALSGIPGQHTLRQAVRRYTWFKPFPDWFLCLLMGQNFDKEITPWEEMFLPVDIARNIDEFTFIDDSGAERKLVDSKRIFHSSKKSPVILNDAPVTWPFALLTGLIIAALLLFLELKYKKHSRPARIFWGLIQSILGLFLGVSGSVLAVALFFMNNDLFQQNINILFVNPLLLIIVPLGILCMVNKSFLSITGRILHIIWTYVFIAGAITLILRVLPFFYQQNQGVLGFILPVAFALSNIPDGIYKLKLLNHGKLH